jgi:hypothetical protein
MIKEYNELKKGLPPTTGKRAGQLQSTIDARITYLTNKIADYQKILDEGDFAPKPKKKPREKSQTELNLMRQWEDKRSEVLKKYAEYHLSHLSGIEWGVDKVAELAHLSRALMTSFDMSGVLRQGGLVAMGHPIMAQRGLFETLASIAHSFNPENALALQGGAGRGWLLRPSLLQQGGGGG